MTLDPIHEAGIQLAHAMLTGAATVPGFDPGEYLRAEVVDTPDDQRYELLAAAVVAAVLQHAGTLRGLHTAGFDLDALLTGYPNHRPPEGETQ